MQVLSACCLLNDQRGVKHRYHAVHWTLLLQASIFPRCESSFGFPCVLVVNGCLAHRYRRHGVSRPASESDSSLHSPSASVIRLKAPLRQDYHWKRQSYDLDYLSKSITRTFDGRSGRRNTDDDPEDYLRKASTPVDPCLKVHAIKGNGAESSEVHTLPACRSGTRRNCHYTRLRGCKEDRSGHRSYYC